MVHGESEIDVYRVQHRPRVLAPADPQRTSSRAPRRASTRCTGSSTPPSSGSPTAASGSRRSTRASASSARSSTRRPAGSARTGTSPTRSLLEEYGERVTRREAEWESRWWSPIINAEHLAMRERAAMIDLTAFAIFDVAGPGALDVVQRLAMRQMDVAVGRVVYTPLLTPSGGFKLGPDDHAPGRRPVPRRHRRRVRDVRPQVVRRPPPPDGSAPARTTRRAPGARSGCGVRARATSSRAVTARRRLARGLPVRPLPDDRGRLAAGARLADLLRRRPRLGAVRADRAGRAAVGHRRRGRRAARDRPRRDRRLRNDRPAGEVLPRLRLRARGRLQRRRGRDGVGQGQGRGLRRQGGAPAPPRRGARRRSCAR